MIEVLIKFGAQVDARTNNFRTPLHIASLRGNLNVIQTLVSNGADINAKDIESNTPCHFVSEYGHRLCLKYLLERNPYLFANNNEDKSAIDVAISSDILNEFQQFIEKSKDFSRDKTAIEKSKKKPAAVVGDTGGQGTSKKDKSGNTCRTSSSDPERGQSPTDHKRSGNSAGQGSGSGVNSSSDGRTGNTSSRLSQRTKMINQVVAKQQKIAQRKDQEADKKVMQIRIHGQEDDWPEGEEKKAAEVLKDGSPFKSEQPTVQEVDGVRPTFRSYGVEHFLPLKKLGSGSFGDVFLVRDRNSAKLYAMKTLAKSKILGQNLVRYAKTERDVLSYMRHPFIVNLHYAFQTKTKLFLILEFCPGGDLGKLIMHERRFSEERARLYMAEVLLALADLHKRDIIYRDLKPDNVVLDDDGHALLTDFGLSKEGVLETSKGAKSFCGSIAYLAPEMLRRVGHGKSVDWYLLGVLLYEMLVGSPAYFSSNKEELFNNIMNGPLKLPRSISTEAKNLMVQLLNRNPTKRLGAGPEGALEIQRHPFFASVNWDDVRERRTKPLRPRIRTEHFQSQYPASEFTDKQIDAIFDDDAADAKGVNNFSDNVDGWSFVKMTESHIEKEQRLLEDKPSLL